MGSKGSLEQIHGVLSREAVSVSVTAPAASVLLVLFVVLLLRPELGAQGARGRRERDNELFPSAPVSIATTAGKVLYFPSGLTLRALPLLAATCPAGALCVGFQRGLPGVGCQGRDAPRWDSRRRWDPAGLPEPNPTVWVCTTVGKLLCEMWECADGVGGTGNPLGSIPCAPSALGLGSPVLVGIP